MSDNEIILDDLEKILNTDKTFSEQKKKKSTEFFEDLSIDYLLSEMVKKGGSDLHISTGDYPYVRLKDGFLHILVNKHLDRNFFERMLQKILKSDNAFIRLLEKEEIDVTYECSAGRFRVNVGLAGLQPFAVFRELKSEIPMPDKLGIPEEFVKIVEEANYGLILIGGTTGSGKSTTMASVLRYVLSRYQEKVITIEDPVEYIIGGFDGCKGYVLQREVGKDTLSFANALRAAVRQDPDYIIVGEVRDIETARNCIIAAETGHIVFATIHVKDSISAIDRFCGVFPIEEQMMIKRRLLDNLLAVQVQVLCPGVNAKRVLATELLILNDEVREMIFKGETLKVRKLLSEEKIGWTLNNYLKKLLKKGLINEEVFRNYEA